MLLTAKELCAVLERVSPQSEVCLYADWQGEVERPLVAVEERVYVCGYFAVRAAEEADGQAILLVGEALPY